MLARLVLACALAVCACATPASVNRSHPSPDWSLAASHGVLSSAGSYWVAYRPLPAEVPLNSEFVVEFFVTAAANRESLLAPDVVLIEARMPGHGHGMIYNVAAELAENGTYLARGMLFHMTGHWELYIDITDGAWTERAQFNIELE